MKSNVFPSFNLGGKCLIKSHDQRDLSNCGDEWRVCRAEEGPVLGLPVL